MAAVSIVTPYVEMVEHTGKYINYSAQDAVEEFSGKPGVFHLRVGIFLTPTYPDPHPLKPGAVPFRPSEFWQDFKIKLIQNDKEIHVQATQGHSIRATLRGE